MENSILKILSENFNKFCWKFDSCYLLELHSAYCIYIALPIYHIAHYGWVPDFQNHGHWSGFLGTICPYSPHWNTRLNYNFPWITSRLNSLNRCREQSVGRYAGSNFETENGNKLRKSTFQRSMLKYLCFILTLISVIFATFLFVL